MRRRKRREGADDEENEEAWVIPYADMITLLMGLFLVLWSISTVDLRKLQEVSESFAGALGGSTASAAPGDAPDATPPPQTGDDGLTAELRRAQARQQRQADERAQLEAAKATIELALRTAGVADQVTLRLDPRGLVVVATEGLLFPTGSAELQLAGRQAIDAVAGPLAELPQPVEVEGHTDDVPIVSATFPSNWELSTARAGRVLRELEVTHHVTPTRLSSAGYGEHRPVADNATPQGRAQNRRVEIVLVAIEG